MNTPRRLLRIINAKKRHRKLLIPIGFLIVELIIAIILNWQLFGEHYEFTDTNGIQQASIHNPLIVIKTIHSERLTQPYGVLSDQDSVVHLFSQKYMLKAFCFMGSLMIAFLGILISMLWIKRFFKHNNLNINWWQWPIACIGAHILLYFWANSSFSTNIF